MGNGFPVLDHTCGMARPYVRATAGYLLSFSTIIENLRLMNAPVRIKRKQTPSVSTKKRKQKFPSARARPTPARPS